MIADLLSDAALIRASGEKTFDRGKTYASSGAVSIVSEDGDPRPAIHARVAGTELYSTSVCIKDGELAGSCDCPSAIDGWVCKHQVAVALIWRQRLSGIEPVVDEIARKKVQTSAKRARTVRDRRQALQEYLRTQPASVLADKLIDLADSYGEIELELRQWQKASDARPEGLKSLVSEILAVGRRFIPLPEVSTYVRRARAVLPLLKQARERDPQTGMALSLHALRGSWAAMMQADDSNGEIGDLSRAIAGEWVEALQGAGAQPAAFGDTYLRVQLEDPFGCFNQRAAETAMGAAALNRYRHALASQWRQIKDSVLAQRAERAAKLATRKHQVVDWLQRDDNESRLWTLERLHLEQLEQLGDVEAALAVLREDLSEPHKIGAVTSFLERHNRLREAFANAELGCKTFPDDWHLQEDLLRCYERDGCTDEAFALRRRQFQTAPSVEGFQQTLKAGLAARKDGITLRQELLEEIEEREVRETQRDHTSSSLSMRRGVDGTRARDVSLRAQILCSEEHWTQACALVQPPAVCNTNVLRHIALHLDDSHRQQALALLLRVFGLSMRSAQTPYRNELELVNEIAERLDGRRRAEWLSSLRIEFKAKRNFVRDLLKA